MAGGQATRQDGTWAAVECGPRGVLRFTGATYPLDRAQATCQHSDAVAHAVSCSGHMSNAGSSGCWSDGPLDRSFGARKFRAPETSAPNCFSFFFRVGPINRPYVAPFLYFSELFLLELSLEDFFPTLICTL